MTINDSVLQSGKKIIFALRELYLQQGYTPYRMSKFEEYDLNARNKDFLVSDQVITFTDVNGRLMALKPDVTLSIIKNSKDQPTGLQKLFYNENVYRVAKGAKGFKEIMQAGLECIGRVDKESIAQVIALAVKSLCTVSPDCVLELSNLSILEEAVGRLDLPEEAKPSLYQAVSEKNLHGVKALCVGAEAEAVEKLLRLVSIRGGIREAKEELRALSDEGAAHTEAFLAVLEMLENSDAADRILIDFSVVNDTNYYNGIVFKGFIRGLPAAVLTGGQYDRLMRKMQRRSVAIGFAVYLDSLGRLPETAESGGEKRVLNVALPKGRLGEQVYAMFEKAGFPCPSIKENSRKLIFENAGCGVRYFWVKPSDVAIYVERGAADIGVAGKDILLEYEPEVYELLDLNVGKCRMAVAAKKDFRDDAGQTLRVATKFSNIAGKYYLSKGRDIDIIHLNGSIELAPILGLSDVIVDIVETGTTLKENDLAVVESIMPISARLICNKAAYKFKTEAIDKLVRELSAQTEGET